MNKHLPMILAANALLFASALAADEAMLPLRPAVPVEALSGAPERITIRLFDGPDDSNPFLIRHFSPDQWKASRKLDEALPESGDIRFQMQLYTADEEDIQPGDILWAEASVDGQPVGKRFRVQATTPPKFTIEGDIEAQSGVFSAADGQPDVVLAGRSNSAAGDDGVLASDPARPDSDLLIQTNDWLAIQLDADNSGNPSAGFSVERNGTKLFQMDKDGNLTYGGPGLSAFPRPAYDSGWVAVAKGASVTWNHNLGGNVDDYVVDMQCKDNNSINNKSIGSFVYDIGTGIRFDGAYYWSLDGSKIEVFREFDNTNCSQIRIRIWKYN